MIGYYPNSHGEPRGSNLDICKTNNSITFIQKCVPTPTQRQAYTYTDEHTYICTHTNIHIHKTYIYIYIYIYIYTYAYIYMHTIYIQNIHTKHDKTELTWKHTCSVHIFSVLIPYQKTCPSHMNDYAIMDGN